MGRWDPATPVGYEPTQQGPTSSSQWKTCAGEGAFVEVHSLPERRSPPRRASSLWIYFFFNCMNIVLRNEAEGKIKIIQVWILAMKPLSSDVIGGKGFFIFGQKETTMKKVQKLMLAAARSMYVSSSPGNASM